MSQLKGSILTSLVVLMAFVWGFQRDTIKLKLSEYREQSSNSWQKITTPKEPVENTSSTPPPLEQNRENKPTVIQELPANPYGKLQNLTSPSTASYNKALANTFEAIRPGKIDPNQKVERNAYFEKLSQQLKDLRGDAPPYPIDNSANSAPPPQPAAENPAPDSPYPIDPQAPPEYDPHQYEVPVVEQMPEEDMMYGDTYE